LGTRVCDGQEPFTGFAGARLLLDTPEEVLLKNGRLQRRPRLAGHDEQGVVELHPALGGQYLGGIGRVQHMQIRKTFHGSEGHSQHFRRQTRTPHAEQQGIGETGGLHLRGQLSETAGGGELVFDNAQPPQPVVFVAPGPQRGIPLPKAAHVTAGLPCGHHAIHFCRGLRGQAVAHLVQIIHHLVSPS